MDGVPLHFEVKWGLVIETFSNFIKTRRFRRDRRRCNFFPNVEKLMKLKRISQNHSDKIAK